MKFLRWKWLGHAYRHEGRYVQYAPKCEAFGKRSRGRPKKIWLRTMKKEEEDDWGEDLQEMADNRCWWSEFIKALCTPWLP